MNWMKADELYILGPDGRAIASFFTDKPHWLGMFPDLTKESRCGPRYVESISVMEKSGNAMLRIVEEGSVQIIQTSCQYLAARATD
jgi:hypothetical protein